MSRPTILIILLLSFLVPQVRGQESFADALDLQINKTLGAYNPDTSWVTAQNRQQVIDRLVARRDLAKDSHFETRALLMLEHEETMKSLAEDLANQPANFHLEYDATPAIIPYVIGLLDTGSAEAPRYESSWEVVVYASVKERAAATILGAVKREKSFPADTIDWARRMEPLMGFKPVKERNELLKEWWRNNREAILEKRYADAKWLPPPYKGKASVLHMQELDERAARLEDYRSTRKNPSSSQAPGAHSPTAKPSGPSAIRIAMAVVLLLLLAAVLRLWITRKRRHSPRP